MKKKSLVLGILSLLLIVIVGTIVSGVLDATYGSRKTLTLKNTFGATLTDFPYLVNGTFYVDTTSGYKSDCFDIKVSDSTDTIQRPHDVVNCTNTLIEVWAIDKSIAVSSTDRFFYHDKAGETVNQENETAWNLSNMTAVYRFNNSLDDASGNAVSLVVESGDIFYNDTWFKEGLFVHDGFVTNSSDIDGVADHPLNPDNQSFTIEFWVRVTVGSSILGRFDSSGAGSEDPAYRVSHSGGNINFFMSDGDAGDGGTCKSLTGNSGRLTDGNWHHVAVVYDKSDNTNIRHYTFFDGNMTGACSGSSETSDATNMGSFVLFGEYAGGSPQVNSGGSSIDELRFHKGTVRSPAWINASYYQANKSALFATLGAEVAAQPDPIITSNADLNTTSIETKLERFNFTVDFNGTIVNNMSSRFTYGGTTYADTETIIDTVNNKSQFLIDLNIPTISTSPTAVTVAWNISTFFNTTLGEVDNFTSSKFEFTQTVDEFKFMNCSGGNSTMDHMLNFSFQDEVNNSFIKGEIVSSTFSFSLTPDLALPNSYTYNSNVLAEESFSFCSYPKNVTLYHDVDLDYKWTPNYGQRKYNKEIVLTQNVTNVTLTLLKNADGLFVTFLVVNQAQQALSDVQVEGTRLIGGSNVSVASGSTGGDGSITFFLNPDFPHIFNFSKTGFDTVTTTITPTQSLYVISLGVTSAPSNESNWFQGMSYKVLPKQNVLDNQTTYEFNFTTTSSFWALNETGFALKAPNGSVLNSSSCDVATGCSTVAFANTQNYTRLIMNYYWIVDGNYTNMSREWIVSQTGSGKPSLVSLFKEDMGKLSESFGIGEHANFTKGLISFFIILAIVGSITFVSGITSPTAILGEVLFLTIVLDLVGMLPQNINNFAIPHFIPFAVLILFMGQLIYDYTR